MDGDVYLGVVIGGLGAMFGHFVIGEWFYLSMGVWAFIFIVAYRIERKAQRGEEVCQR